MRNLCFVLMICLCGNAASAEPEKPVLMCSDLCDAEVSNLTATALSGSAEDALALSWHYSDQGDKKEALFWSQVAMENGSQAGRYNFASMLVEIGDFRSLARARYHFEILRKEGHYLAETRLKEIESEAKAGR